MNELATHTRPTEAKDSFDCPICGREYVQCDATQYIAMYRCNLNHGWLWYRDGDGKGAMWWRAPTTWTG